MYSAEYIYILLLYGIDRVCVPTLNINGMVWSHNKPGTSHKKKNVIIRELLEVSKITGTIINILYRSNLEDLQKHHGQL
jgi:hypothetical protein